MKRHIKTSLKICAISLSMCVAATTDSFAESPPTCGTHKQITSTLESLYREKPMHRGLTPKGTMIEVFSSDNGTFTVVMTLPTGRSCLVSAGTHWQEVDASSHPKDKGISGGISQTF